MKTLKPEKTATSLARLEPPVGNHVLGLVTRCPGRRKSGRVGWGVSVPGESRITLVAIFRRTIGTWLKRERHPTPLNKHATEPF